jgi:hypothetical protein
MTSRSGQVVQPAHHLEVLEAGQVLVDGRVLPGEPDRRAHRPGVADHVQPDHLGPPRVGAEQRGQDPDHRGLPRAVGAEQPEHGPLGHGQVHSVECGGGAEALHQPLDDDRIGHAGHARPDR